MLLLLERDFCTGELEHQGGSRVGTYFESWPRCGVGGRRAPSFYFFTPGYRHFQSNQQQSESSWGKLNQTWSAHDIISSKYQNQVKIATSFLTSWELDGNQQPRRRDKRKYFSWAELFKVQVVHCFADICWDTNKAVNNDTMVAGSFSLSTKQTAQMDNITLSNSA